MGPRRFPPDRSGSARGGISSSVSDASRRIDADELLAHAGWLRALARSLVRDEHAADDVVQETFAAAVSRPPRDRGALRAWLAKVARHTAWKSHRGDARRTAREQATPSRGAEPSSSEIVERIETQRALLDAVQALEEPYRTVVMMRFYDGKPPREIARELGVAPEVVWQRLSRALAMLRARLDAGRGGRDAWAGVFVFWLGGREAAGWTGATALGTGAAIMGTKTVVVAAAAAGLAAWYLWPAPSTAPVDTSRESAAIAQPSPVAKPATAPRVRPVAADATPSEPATSAVPRARTHGRVVDAVSGEPLAGARVKVVRKSPGGGFQWTLTTGADGTFSGEVEETKRYSAELEWSAVHSDLYVEASARGHIRFYEGPYTTAKGDDLGDIRLDRGAAVTGRVVYDDGRAAAGAHVYATAGAAQIGTDDPLNRARPLGVAGDDGRFELDEALCVTRPGEAFTLLAATDDGVGWRTVAVRDAAGPIDVTLTLSGAPHPYSVSVVDADDRPVADAVVTAYPRFGAMGVLRGDAIAYSIAGDDLLRSRFVRSTGADGSVRFAALPVESRGSAYEFAAVAPGFTTGWAHGYGIGVADARVEIRLAREQAFVVGGRVVDADGRPVEGALVTVRGAEAEPLTTDAAGVFVLRRDKGDPFGRDASVEITKDGYAKRSETVRRWPDDGRPMGEIELRWPAPVAGRIVDEDGRPVAGATIHLQRTETWVKARGDGRSDADGRFEFPDATEGDWALVVFPGGGGRWVVPPWKAVRGGDADVVVRLERLPEGRATVVVTVVNAESGAPADVDGAMLVDAGPPSGRQVMGASRQPRVEHGRVTIDRVEPGNHVLWLRVADRPHQLVRIRVADGETAVRVTCRVRRGSSLTGRVRLPEGVTGTSVHVEYALADGQLSAGGPGWGAATAAGLVKAAADGTFRIDGVTPAAYRLTAHLAGWLGDAVVDATDGDAAGDIDLTRGAVVEVAIPGGMPGVAMMRVEASLNGAAWTTLTTAGLVPDRPFTVPKTLPPGRLLWRATFRASLNPFDPLDAAEPQSGELVLEPGKDVEIVVPVVPKK